MTLRLLQDVELREIKKILATRSKEVGMVQKKVSGHETELEQKRADRHSILKMCKVCNMTTIIPVKVIGWNCIQFADIKLPFRRGSMDDIEDEVCSYVDI